MKQKLLLVTFIIVIITFIAGCSFEEPKLDESAIEFIEEEAFLGSDGYYHLMGVLENKSNYKLDLIIWITAYNEDNVQIDTGVANVFGLVSNGKAEFQGRITNKDMHSYKISQLVIQYEEESGRFRQSEIDL